MAISMAPNLSSVIVYEGPAPDYTPPLGTNAVQWEYTTDQINDGIRVPNFFLKALRPVINDRVRTEVAHEGNIVRAHAYDRFHTPVTGQLNRVRPDISRRPVNDHRLTCLELGVIEQRLPGRHGNDRNGGGFNVRQSGWPRGLRWASPTAYRLLRSIPGIAESLVHQARRRSGMRSV